MKQPVDEFGWPELPGPPPWLIYDGDASLQQGDLSISGEARVWFTLDDTPTARYDFRSKPVQSPSATNDLDDKAKLSTARGINTHLEACEEGDLSSDWGSSGPATALRVWGSPEGLIGGDGSRLNTLRLHLVNFAKDQLITRDLEVDVWTIRVRPTGTEPSRNRFAITHVLDLARSDRSEFSVDDAQRTVSWLFDALAFATGQFVGFALPQGHLAGSPMFLKAECTKANTWKARRSWWDGRSFRSDDLEELCNRWAIAAADERTKMLLRRAAALYTQAIDPNPQDTAVPVAGIGLELMVWEMIHQHDQILTTHDYDGLSASSRLRLALRLAGISAAVPEELAALKAYVKDSEIPDGPTGFATVRNRLVHPPKKKRGWPPGDVMIEAWQLGVEYFALLVLASVGYEGNYRSQLGFSGWPGSEIPVPWNRPDPDRH